MQQLFFYGTLRDYPLLAVVLGRAVEDIAIQPATLPGFEICAVRGEVFPYARKRENSVAAGILVSDLTDEDVARLCYYEGAYLYGLTPQQVDVGGQTVEAQVFLSDENAAWVPDGLWDLDRWQAWDGGLAAEAAKEVMSYYGLRPAEEVLSRFGTIRIRAAARLAARQGPPVNLRQGFGDSDVETIAIRRPYLNFFALEEHDLRFRRFDGSYSETVERAVFVSADAVTVLPYDPWSDRVLLIEQFRAGPHARGDRHPWALEPIAGRVDLGENYSDTAHREAREEADLTLDALEEIARYYTSPGAVSEYIVSYLGITRLSLGHEEVHGVVSEHEDIRSLVVPFEGLMQAVSNGEAENGPLLVTALWLQANRSRLRAKYAGA
jgi:ADP-ribose pyrophosphatase